MYKVEIWGRNYGKHPDVGVVLLFQFWFRRKTRLHSYIQQRVAGNKQTRFVYALKKLIVHCMLLNIPKLFYSSFMMPTAALYGFVSCWSQLRMRK